MAIESRRDLMLYETSIMRDAERTSGSLFMLLASRTHDDGLAQALRTAEQQAAQHLTNLDECLAALDVNVVDSRSETVEGIRIRYERFLTLQPAEHVTDIFTAETAAKALHFCISSYKSLVNWGLTIGEDRCAQRMQTNLQDKEAAVASVERISHDIIEQLSAVAR